MSLSVNAIQDIEAKASEIAEQYHMQIRQVSDNTAMEIEKSRENSRKDIESYQEDKEERSRANLLTYETVAKEHLEKDISDLTNRVKDLEKQLVLEVLEEVNKRYGSV